MMVGDKRSSATTRRGDVALSAFNRRTSRGQFPWFVRIATPSPHAFLTVNKLKAPPLLLEPTFDLVPCTKILLLQGEALVLGYICVSCCADPRVVGTLKDDRPLGPSYQTLQASCTPLDSTHNGPSHTGRG
jgi:hypothetical protein